VDYAGACHGAALRADPTKNAAACTSFNYGSGNVIAPDLCWVRRPNVKVGIGVNAEQHVTSDLGVFTRFMYADGQTEVDAFNPADRSASVGATSKGSAWRRPFDVAGIAYGSSWISSSHARYLAAGGVDGFVGDGHLTRAAENVFEVFYSVNLLKSYWLSGDYQHLWNPGFNADRGPVTILGGRVHGPRSRSCSPPWERRLRPPRSRTRSATASIGSISRLPERGGSSWIPSPCTVGSRAPSA